MSRVTPISSEPNQFCNHMQLNRVLPPGPREYWDQLVQEHRSAPDSLRWKYEPDPFAAKRQFEKRQAELAKHGRQHRHVLPSERDAGAGANSFAFIDSPRLTQVKMGESLRAMIDEVITQNMDLLGGQESPNRTLGDIEQLTKQLRALQFSDTQIELALAYRGPLLGLTELDSCLEFLLLTLPESSLPIHFQPKKSASAPFITSLHAGSKDELSTRWLAARVANEGGWPEPFVVSILHGLDNKNISHLVLALNRHLITLSHPNSDGLDLSLPDGDITYTPLDEQIDALTAIYNECAITNVNNSTKLISIPLEMSLLQAKETIELCIVYDQDLPFSPIPPMYLRSITAPPYIRIHLLSDLLHQLLIYHHEQPGEAVLMEAIGCLEGSFNEIRDHPPDIRTVLSWFGPVRIEPPTDVAHNGGPANSKPPRKMKKGRQDTRDEKQIVGDFERMRGHPKYPDMLAQRNKLPVTGFREDFIKVLGEHRVVVVVGDTGSGKTTQLPQYILDSRITSGYGMETNILVTQPRRVAAISVSDRVSAERMNDGSVGYAIRGETRVTSKTKLCFCTTGVILRRLTNVDKEEFGLSDCSHLIIDEVHERSVESDFLLLEVKELLQKNTNIKVILMSATIDPSRFANYFGGAPVFRIPGRTYPVQDFFLENIIDIVPYTPGPQRAGALKKWSPEERKSFQDDPSLQSLSKKSISVLETLIRKDAIDFELVVAVVRQIVSQVPHERSEPCGILIFMPGVEEIRQCINMLKDAIGSNKAVFFPLHAGLTSAEQRAVFQNIDLVKVVVSTNVAETSITIDDITVVVDTGRVKETSFHPETGLMSLTERWVSQAASGQRRGRAGRSRPGTCYRLYTSGQFAKLAPFTTPEILRIPLENVLLMAKAIRKERAGGNKDVLSKALDSPDSVAVARAEALLLELGATNEDGGLTALGTQMSSLPLDVGLAKMLLLGLFFRCIDKLLTIVALLSSKPLWHTPADQRDAANKAKRELFVGRSDLLTDCSVFERCLQERLSSVRSFAAFCKEHYIQPSVIQDIETLKNDLHRNLVDAELLSDSIQSEDPRLNENSANEALLRALILGGLWPRVARVYLPSKDIKFDKGSAGSVRRMNEAKEFHLLDISNNSRVFVHPSSVMFAEISGKSSLVVYFSKQQTTKPFIRNISEVSTYSILLFGGPVVPNHVKGIITCGKTDKVVRLASAPRIAVLVNQLRRLLDCQLEQLSSRKLISPNEKQALLIKTILALLETDGISH